MRKRKPTQAESQKGEQGFSLIELLVTFVVLGIAAGMAAIVITGVLPTVHADSALDEVVSELQQTRQQAINQRRNFLVTFNGTNELVIARVNLGTPATTTQVADYFLAQGMVYSVLSGLPDTPDRFDNGTPLNFGDGTSITFNSDGTVTDSTGKLVDYEVFMAIPGDPSTARAVTIMGATARVKGYRYNGSAWK